MRGLRILPGIAAFVFASANLGAAHPAVDGRIHAVAPKEISKVIAVAQQHPYALSKSIYRLHVVSRNEVEVYYGKAPKHYKDIETYLLVERIKGKWQVTRTMVMGRNDPVE